METKLICGDCLEVLDDNSLPTFDLVYLDPPFYSQKKHALSTRDGESRFEFSDVWRSHDEYARFIHARLLRAHSRLSSTGSIFFHCDSHSTHIARLVLDEVFGAENFQSEIIWHYKRWSNSRKGLLPAHQTILFYAKTGQFKFNQVLTAYSETTNADQILQRRARDDRGKAVYAKDENGEVVHGGSKQGVPLGDVWEIPFLNPKAAERVGYPTQKPVLLLERIVSLVTNPGDWVLDPFCGSGTTLVAARLLNRNSLGVDTNPDAIRLAQRRLEQPIRTESRVMTAGRQSYLHPEESILRHLGDLEYVVVPRNRGLDAILKQEIDGRPVFVRIQRANENVSEAASALKKASTAKGNPWLVLIQTSSDRRALFDDDDVTGVVIVQSVSTTVPKAIEASVDCSHSRRHRCCER
jgi:site-specific DNA-methyltransferase (adenine-specific)